MRYDHPQFTLIHEAIKERYAGTSMGAANAALVPSTFRTYYKAVVLGVTVVNRTAGSGGTFSNLKVARFDSGGTMSLRDTVAQTTLAAAQITSIDFSSPITIDGADQGVALYASASAATDVPKIGQIIWRYRMLPNPTTAYPTAHTVLG